MGEASHPGPAGARATKRRRATRSPTPATSSGAASTAPPTLSDALKPAIMAMVQQCIAEAIKGLDLRTFTHGVMQQRFGQGTQTILGTTGTSPMPTGPRTGSTRRSGSRDGSNHPQPGAGKAETSRAASTARSKTSRSSVLPTTSKMAIKHGGAGDADDKADDFTEVENKRSPITTFDLRPNDWTAPVIPYQVWAQKVEEASSTNNKELSAIVHCVDEDEAEAARSMAHELKSRAILFVWGAKRTGPWRLRRSSKGISAITSVSGNCHPDGTPRRGAWHQR